MDLIENLKWRYAAKRFDSNKKVTEADIEQLQEVIRLSASSYGLQLYKVLIIKDQKLKEKLRPYAWNQSQVEDASHLFVFCNYVNNFDSLIDSFQKEKAKNQGVEPSKIQAYKDFVLGKIGEKTQEEIEGWTAMQAYIALGNLLVACAELKIDSCPMEGFEPDKFDEVLNLKEKGLSAAVLACVGYRHEEDRAQNGIKIRRLNSELFELI